MKICLKLVPRHIAERPQITPHDVIFGCLELVFSATGTLNFGCMATIEALDFPIQDLVSEVKNLCPNRSYDHFTDPPRGTLPGVYKTRFLGLRTLFSVNFDQKFRISVIFYIDMY